MSTYFFKTIIYLILLLTSTNLSAQTTFYYKQIKKIVNGQTTTCNTFGGQFITFQGRICYESDSNGIPVGHGSLNYQDQGNDLRIYIGSSYWGSNTQFRFNRERSRLNVVTSNGEIYAYTKTEAPASVSTCSLIRTNKRNRSNTNVYVPTANEESYQSTTTSRQIDQVRLSEWKIRKSNAERQLEKYREELRKDPNNAALKSMIRSNENILNTCNERIAEILSGN